MTIIKLMRYSCFLMLIVHMVLLLMKSFIISQLCGWQISIRIQLCAISLYLTILCHLYILLVCIYLWERINCGRFLKDLLRGLCLGDWLLLLLLKLTLKTVLIEYLMLGYGLILYILLLDRSFLQVLKVRIALLGHVILCQTSLLVLHDILVWIMCSKCS